MSSRNKSLLLGFPLRDLVIALTPLEVVLLLVLDGLGVISLEGLFGVTVEEEVNLDLPGEGAGDGTTHAEHLTGEEPVHHTNSVLTTVVARNSDVNVLERRVSIAEGDDGNVDKASLIKSLVVSAGVGDDEDTGLRELSLDLVGERTGDEAASHVLGTSVLGVLEDSTLSEEADGADTDVSGVLNSNDDTGGEHELLPSGVEVEDVDAVLGTGVDVALHLVRAVLGSEVDVRSEELLDVLLVSAEDVRSGVDLGHFRGQ